MYVCPKCKHFIWEVMKFIRRLRVFHALSDSQDFQIVCSQRNCKRTYHNLNSFTKHLKRDHLNLTPEEHIDNGHEPQTASNISADFQQRQAQGETTENLRPEDDKQYVSTLTDCAA